METILLITFFLSVGAMLHSYLVYPWLLSWLAAQKPPIQSSATPSSSIRISVLMAVYNEEQVLEEKLQTLVQQQYDPKLLEIWVGSDCSSDRTNDILKDWSTRYPQIRAVLYDRRQGKPSIINDLSRRAADPAPNHLYLITDASVMLQPEVSARLANHFADPKMAIVDAHMVPVGMDTAGISQSESSYLNREVLLKHWEGQVWGAMIGPFGGCFALRSTYFSPVPANYLVDDFYLCMRALEQGGRAISDLKAVCHEAVSHEMREEYRRKRRISAGNVQNMRTFWRLWWPPFGCPNFAFFSHKILRWLGPFWLLGILFSSAGLVITSDNLIYLFLFLLIVCGMLVTPSIDWLLQFGGIHLKLGRHIRYFLIMNVALLAGFVRYAKGVRTNVWQPPKRH